MIRSLGLNATEAQCSYNGCQYGMADMVDYKSGGTDRVTGIAIERA